MFADTGIKLSPKMSGVLENRERNGFRPRGGSNAANGDGGLDAAGVPAVAAGAGVVDGFEGLAVAGGAGTFVDGAEFAVGFFGAGWLAGAAGGCGVVVASF
jgi:hypothetical protein